MKARSLSPWWLSPWWLRLSALSRARSIRLRMTFLFALLIALLLLAGGSYVQKRERKRAEERIADALQLSLDRASAELAERKEFHQPLVDVVRQDQGEISSGGTALVVADSQNNILWQSSHEAPDWPERNDRWRVRTLLSGGQTLIVARAWLPVEEELEERAHSLWQLGTLVLGATALLVWFMVGGALSPLHRLAAQAENASIEDLQVRLVSPSSDAEMRHLTTTLNGLLARLEREARARGRFYAAASHELRTPIQILLGEIDVARSRRRTVEEHEHFLAQAQNGTERLASLVQDLLQLNALEMRQSTGGLETINMAVAIKKALQEQETLLRDRALSLEVQVVNALLAAPSTHIEMLLRNLTGNAVKYATPGTTIRVGLSCFPEETLFEIENTCGRREEEGSLEQWFEPFFRLDASRSSQTGGNGLGLAICRALCVSNGWTIALSARESGVRVVVKFPRIQPDQPPEMTHPGMTHPGKSR